MFNNTRSFVDILIKHFGGKSIAGSRLKAQSSEWKTNYNDKYAANSNFNALPAGYFMNSDNTFKDLGFWACFWTSEDQSDEDAIVCELYCDDSVIEFTNQSKMNKYSVRCIKD
jgi:uncharacterized protein (TIGR02145 family)